MTFIGRGLLPFNAPRDTGLRGWGKIPRMIRNPFSGRPQGGVGCVFRRKTRPFGPPLKGLTITRHLFPASPARASGFKRKRTPIARSCDRQHRPERLGKKCHRTPKLFNSRGRKPRSAVFFARKPGLPPQPQRPISPGSQCIQRSRLRSSCPYWYNRIFQRQRTG